MKNVSLIIEKDNFGDPIVKLLIDNILVKTFYFDNEAAAEAFKDGFRECESRFCKLDIV